MQYATKHASALIAALLLSSCGGGSGGDLPELPPAPQGAGLASAAVSDFPVKLGAPYTVGSTTYMPEDAPAYDDVGYASYYGGEMGGRTTANGEIFMPSGVTAAHKTLPMPSYVEVTSLDTGRTILVRVNDRGPFANDRVIDLSEGAAQQLGITGNGLTGVRIRRVNPPEQERATLRQGLPAPQRMDTPESLLKVLREKLAKMPKPSGAVAPRPVVTPSKPSPQGRPPAVGNDGFAREGDGAPAPSKAKPAPKPAKPVTAKPAVVTSGYVVQVASFGTRARAEALARQLGAKVSVSADGKLFRVRYGPYATEAEAQRSLATAKQKGYSQARMFHE